MKDTRTPAEQVGDGYNKAAYGVPYDRELEAMTYKQLAVALEQSKEGSARHSVIALEMEKRKPSAATGAKIGWIHRIGEALIVGVVASLIATVLWLLYGRG